MRGATLSTPDSEALCRVALANYFAGAVMMPYEPFLNAASSLRYDIELLEERFGASFEQVCHRLTNLNAPTSRGVPFHLVRVDMAGNISKRFNGSGIHLARYGGACPRWNVHEAFTTPGLIRIQVSRQPDGRTYFCIARSLRKGGGGYHVPQSRFSVGTRLRNRSRPGAGVRGWRRSREPAGRSFRSDRAAACANVWTAASEPFRPFATTRTWMRTCAASRPTSRPSSRTSGLDPMLRPPPLTARSRGTE